MTQTQFGAFPTHPGTVIRDEIEYRHITRRKLAEYTNLPYESINNILIGKQGIDAHFAHLIEQILGIPAYILINLQKQYNMQVASSL